MADVLTKTQRSYNMTRIRSQKTGPELQLCNLLKKNYSPKVLDLFAGAGGLSEGFVRAGCKVVGHIEMDRNSCDTLITRMIYHALLKREKFEEYRNYILGKVTRDELIEKYNLQTERDSVICAKIGADNYEELIAQVKKRLNGGQLDIVVGGPPCQAYSHIGRAVDDKNMRWDNRKFLYRYYVEFLKALKPKIFVFENVPGLMTSGKGRYLREMRKLMKRAGYETDFRVLNTVDFGVPQNRRRIILVGWNKESKLDSYPEFPVYSREYFVRDFFSDLPKIKAGAGQQIIRNFVSNNKVLGELVIANPNLGILMDHVARPHKENDLEIYRIAIQVKADGGNIKYNELPKRLKTHKNECAFLDRFKVIDAAARGSQTILAHIAKDGHYYIHPDLKQNRSLTVREAARLQTFPDDYKLEGGRGSQFRQIGNAVPPMFSSVIAAELIKYI
jgi:DNA (cytosine-5)-methyltransferase 1